MLRRKPYFLIFVRNTKNKKDRKTLSSLVVNGIRYFFLASSEAGSFVASAKALTKLPAFSKP